MDWLYALVSALFSNPNKMSQKCTLKKKCINPQRELETKGILGAGRPVDRW